MIDNKEKKYFASIGEQPGALNSDDAFFAIGQNEWVNAENVRTLTTDAGETATLESIGGTLSLSSPQPSLTFLTIGAAEDTENSRFCFFKYCTTGPWHKIVCWDDILQQEFDVLLAAQVEGGLNFDKDSLIHSVRIVDGLLYWTDNLNAQRKINIDAGIKLNNPSYVTSVAAYTSPIDYKVITLLRPPPLYSLSVSKVTQPSLTNNFLKTDAFQFAYSYHYRDGETSVLSNYSQLAPYNISTDTYNRIDVVVSFNELIPQDAQQVNIATRYGNVPNFFIIKTWDKNNAADLAEIQAHNAGITQLTYSFYNDQIGQPLDSAYSVKPFDSVPVLSETLEVARERLFLGNNIEGYDAPTITSLAASFTSQTNNAGADGTWGKIIYQSHSTFEAHFFITLTNVGVYNGYYDTSAGALTTPVAWATMTFIGTTESDILAYWPKPPATGVFFTPSLPNVVTITGAPFSVSLIGSLCYKSNSPYRVAVQFYDFGDRKSGVVENGQTYQTADRAYGTLSYTVSLDWTLSNTNAINEIPDWATHYAVVRTKCLRTSFFLQAKAANLTYVTKDANGDYKFETSAYAATLNGVGIDISSLNNFAMGYLFNEGDIIKIYKTGDSNVYSLKITGQSGKWLIAELQNLSTLGTATTPYTTSLFEIYTPYYQSFNEAYFETGDMYAINSPGTTSREYSVLSDSIRGDVVILNRGSYLTENMSGNDAYYKNWYTDAGRPCFKDTLGQKAKTNSVSWSNIYIPGSNNNGLSSFDALDQKLLPIECGSLNKLQLTSKVSNELGVVMLGVCAKETASLYIGEVQLVGQTGNAFIAQAPQVIGTINVLKGSFGTINPESVVEFRGNVFWFDAGNGKVIQYSSNGLFPISGYKMTRFWKLFSDLYMSMTVAEIEALGSRPYIFTQVDPQHNELLLSIPKLSNTPPKGYLPDYPDTIYPFDIWDAQGKTIVFKLDAGYSQPHWQGSYAFNPEYFITLQNKLYSFYQGNLYLHNQTSNYNQFYGIQHKSKIMFVSNQVPNRPKVYNSISVEGNLIPTLTYFRSESPYIQASDLVDFDYNNLEGFYYATLYRNKLIPTATGFNTNGLLTAEKMRTNNLLIMLEFTINTEPLELRFTTIGYTPSIGHTT